MTTLLYALGWLLVGEVIACFTAVLLPASLQRGGQFAWHWASARVLAWPLVLAVGVFYALSIPVRRVHAHLSSEATGLRKVA